MYTTYCAVLYVYACIHIYTDIQIRAIYRIMVCYSAQKTYASPSWEVCTPGPYRCSRRAKERFLPQFPTGPATCAGSQLSCQSQPDPVALVGFVSLGNRPRCLTHQR